MQRGELAQREVAHHLAPRVDAGVWKRSHEVLNEPGVSLRKLRGNVNRFVLQVRSENPRRTRLLQVIHPFERNFTGWPVRGNTVDRFQLLRSPSIWSNERFSNISSTTWRI